MSTPKSNNIPEKQMPWQGMSAFPRFVLNICVSIPLYLGLILPATVAWNILAYPFKTVPNKGIQEKKDRELQEKLDKKFNLYEIQAVSAREYDLVLFGATGFTGKLAAKYLATQYGTSINWAIAGRSKERLQKVKNEIVRINGKCQSVPILIADSSNVDQLTDIAEKTKVIISTVGPFARYGTPLVAVCAHSGTNYCDITGEVHWVRQMIDKYDDIAHQTGAKLVSCCGCDSVPWDISTFMQAKKLEEQGEKLAKAQYFDEMNGGASGGTLETVFESINAVQSGHKKNLCGFDPMQKKIGEKERSTNACKVDYQKFLGYSGVHKTWVGFFVMAMVNAQIVKRSNNILGYADKMKYYEGMVFANFMHGFNTTIEGMIFGTLIFLWPAQWFLRSFVLPKPGEGPSEKDCEKHFLKVIGYGEGTKGSKVKSVMYFPNDPGYVDTARMLVESGLSLSLEESTQKIKGGYHTTASASGETLLKRLVDTGCTFKCEIVGAKKND